jgi:hypothetical protein
MVSTSTYIDDVGIIQTIMIDKLGIPWHIIIKLSLVLGLDC